MRLGLDRDVAHLLEACLGPVPGLVRLAGEADALQGPQRHLTLLLGLLLADRLEQFGLLLLKVALLRGELLLGRFIRGPHIRKLL